MDTIVAHVAGRLFAIAGLIGAMALFFFFSKIPDQQAAADQLDVTARRAEQWLTETFAQRVTDTAAGLREYVPTTDQTADPVASLIFPPAYVNRNVYGQTHTVKVWQPTPAATTARLYALVQTCNGDTMPPADAARAASLATDAGFVSELDPATITSSAGSWANVAAATVTTTACPVTVGHLAKLIQLDGGQVRPPFIHQYKVGSDPEPNTMHTTLFMGGETIENVRDVQLSNGKWLSGAVMDVRIVPDGTVVPKPSCPHGSPAIYMGQGPTTDNGKGRPLVGVLPHADDNGTTWTVRYPVYTVNDTGTGNELVPPGAHAQALVLIKCE